jgi:uncharacterized protein YqeY
MEESESLRSRLEADLKVAMRAGDQPARDTIRYLLSAVKNAEIDKRSALTEPESVALLHRQAKQRQESIDQFRNGGRQDLVEREEAQLAILRRYLPTPLTDDELGELARSVVAEVGATTPKDLGRVMSILVPRAAGRADGRRLNEAARQALGSG